MNRTKQSGFTLIEVVIIVAVVGILAAIAIPNMIGWAPKYRLQNAANDLRGELQKLRMQAIRERSELAAYFNLGADTYQIVEPGADRIYQTTDLVAANITKTVNLGDYETGIGFGHGDAGANNVGDDIGPIVPGDVSFNNATLVFTPTGILKNDGNFGGGFAYLTNRRGDAFAVGTPTIAGIVTLRIWDGNAWTQ